MTTASTDAVVSTGVVKENSKLMASSLVLSVGSIVSIVAMARLALPSVVGQYVSVLAAASTVSTFLSLRLDAMIPLRPGQDEVAKAATSAQVGTMVLALPALLAYATLVVDGSLLNPAGIVLLAAALLVLGFTQVGTGIASAELAFGRISASRIAQGLAMPLVLAGLLLVNGQNSASLTMLVAADLVGRSAALLPLIQLILAKGAGSLAVTRQTVAEMRSALTTNSAAALLSVLALYLPILLVPAMIDETESGLFALVFRFVALPAAFVGGAVQRTLPRMARDVTISQKREWVRNTGWFGLGLCVVGVLTLVVFGGLVLDLVGSDTWEGLILPLTLAVPWAIAWAASQVPASLVLSYERHHVLFVASAADLASKAAVVLPLWFNPTAATATAWLSVSSILVAVFTARYLLRTDMTAEKAAAE